MRRCSAKKAARATALPFCLPLFSSHPALPYLPRDPPNPCHRCAKALAQALPRLALLLLCLAYDPARFCSA